ncbi:Uncharacterized protein Adt_45347 [Abeliophyllum distichum]|uniref:Ycf2 n=1 Tax=Abeliophyllum distichum TaxID=126358 RepID=A0ABD1PDF5_9LAMI
MFLRLHKTYVKNPNHNLLEHLNPVNKIIRGADKNGHSFHRDEIVYHLQRTLSPYWKQFMDEIEQKFEYQTPSALLMMSLREKWLINDNRKMIEPDFTVVALS